MSSINNLDEKHNEMLDLFHHNETIEIPKLQKEKEILKSKLTILKKNQIDTKLDIQDQIKELSKKIKKLKLEKKNYFLDNSKYIFDFYEKKKSQ